MEWLQIENRRDGPMIRGLINGLKIEAALFLIAVMVWEGIKNYA